MHNLDSFEELDVAEYELRSPLDSAPLDIWFSLAGPEHSKRKQLGLTYARELRRKINRTGKLTLDDPADDADREVDYLVACTLGWRNLEIEGQSVQCTAAAARTLYENPKFAWVRRQIKAALDETENFIRNSPPR
jgi:hypothetical protein